MAHIGIYRYLLEHNVKISCISGTSAGAIIGAAIAVGMSYEDIIHIVDDLNVMKLIDINLRTGFLKGEKIRRFFESVFGQTRLEDCIIPLIITSVDINTGEQVIHKT